MADLITTDELRARLGFTPAAAQEAALITDASALIELNATRYAVELDPDAVPAALLPVLANMILRAIDNPHGLTQRTDGSESWSSDKGGIYLTKDEAKIVRRALGLPPWASIQIETDSPRWLHGGVSGEGLVPVVGGGVDGGYLYLGAP